MLAIHNSPLSFTKVELGGLRALGAPSAMVVVSVLVPGPFAGIVLPRAYPANHHTEDGVTGYQALKILKKILTSLSITSTFNEALLFS